MAQTVVANKLTISHKGTMGMEMCSAPDVCNTPAAPSPVPIPYMIISQASSLSGGTTTVSADGGNSIAIMGSKHAQCNGDQPGSLGGVVSGVFGQASEWITFSPNVTADGKSVCRLTDKLMMNNKNTVAASGHIVLPAMVTDPVEQELCDAFCLSRQRWIKSGYKRPSPSARAESEVNNRLADKDSALNKAIEARHPGCKGVCEQTFYKGLDPGQKMDRTKISKAGMRKVLNGGVDKAVASGVGAGGKNVPVGEWIERVDGANNVLRGETGTKTADQLRGMIGANQGIADRSIRVRPDFAIKDANGDCKKIYDFKFDNPKTGWQDKWQKNDQEKAYTHTTGKKPKAITSDTCGCRPPSKKEKKAAKAKKAGTT